MEKVLNKEQFRKMQLEQFNALIKYLEDRNMEYFLAYGTMLGAVRHKGYIPWDDDIDIYVPREDYEILKKSADCINNRYRFYSVNSKDEYHIPFIKFVDTDTKIIEDGMSNDMYGLYIDIFPLDGLGNYKFAAKLKQKFVNFILNRFYGCIHGENGLLKKFLFSPFKLVGFKKLYNFSESICRSSSYEKSKYRGNIVMGHANEILDKNGFTPSKFQFEDSFYKGIKEYDVYLKSLYGDYMTLPSEKDRVSHNIQLWIK